MSTKRARRTDTTPVEPEAPQAEQAEQSPVRFQLRHPDEHGTAEFPGGEVSEHGMVVVDNQRGERRLYPWSMVSLVVWRAESP